MIPLHPTPNSPYGNLACTAPGCNDCTQSKIVSSDQIGELQIQSKQLSLRTSTQNLEPMFMEFSFMPSFAVGSRVA